MPGMTVLTVGFERIKRRASSGMVIFVACSWFQTRNVSFIASARSTLAIKFSGKICIPPIAFGPMAVFAQLAGQRSFIKWDACNHGDIHLFTSRKQLVFRILIE